MRERERERRGGIEKEPAVVALLFQVQARAVSCWKSPKTLSPSATSHSLRRSLSIFVVANQSSTPATVTPSSLRHFAADEPRKGTDILVEALECEGIANVFAYPSGASMEIHEALTHSPSITNHLLHHEQGEAFAASSYAHSTRLPGVCIATFSTGATNLVSTLTNTLLDSTPMVAITD